MDPSLERRTKNESLFRDVNERIEALEREFGSTDKAEFVCECDRIDCSDRFEMRCPNTRSCGATRRRSRSCGGTWRRRWKTSSPSGPATSSSASEKASRRGSRRETRLAEGRLEPGLRRVRREAAAADTACHLARPNEAAGQEAQWSSPSPNRPQHVHCTTSSDSRRFLVTAVKTSDRVCSVPVARIASPARAKTAVTPA